VLGDLLTVLMFFFVATKVEIEQIGGGLALGLLLVAVRAVVKVGICTAFARVSGISARKGALSGLALTPMAVFAILLMEQTRWIGVDLFNSLAPLAAVMLLLDVAGPILTQRAVIWANETRAGKEI